MKDVLVHHDENITSLREIQDRIVLVRGVQVMLDRDLAVFYRVDTGQLNRQVKRNINRFPDDFMFQLTKEEWKSLKCQFGISNTRGGDRRSIPYVFTEEGVSQLSGVLHSEFAEETSVKIMRAFVAMRRFITANAGLFQRVEAIEYKQIETDKKLDVILNKIEVLSPPISTEQLFATGCIWDAYTFVCNLVRSAKNNIVLIDNYVDERTLLLLDKREKDVDCMVYTRYNNQTNMDFEKHNNQYPPIQKVQLSHQIHDRYLIIDNDVWLLGASIKDIGHGLCTVIKTDFTPDMVFALI